MTIAIRRRHFLAASLGGAAALALPAQVRAATMGRGFTHAVASGEPGPNSVMLWTRYAAPASETELSWQVAEDAEFGRIVGEGSCAASEATGHCAKAAVTGLSPATWYFYRFRAPNGDLSPVGRTRTLPAEGLSPFAMAVFSCSNLPFGYFNAYAHAARRNDIHLAVHLGDYIYEYPAGRYPSEEEVVGGREVDPETEIVSLSDYHTRYSLYRSDPDLQRLHQIVPMISIWDDHEIANDAWMHGAENHQPESEGDWEQRKAAALAAYRHWLPMSDEPYKAYEIGDLATLFRLDTRLIGRDEQIDPARILAEAGSMEAGIARLRNQVWSDPARQLLGAQQEAWLAKGLAASAAAKRWQVLAQQVVMGSAYTPVQTTEWIDPASPPMVMQRVQGALALAQVGIPANLDAWGGYPAARSRLLSAAQQADANLIVLAGDSHNAWAFNLAEDGSPAGVEFGVQSVTSPGFEAYFTRTDPQVVAGALMESSPELAWCNTSRRGYGVVSLGAEEARGDYIFVDTIKERSGAAATAKSFTVAQGRKTLAEA
ncbi:alkaline phosphatase [Pacificimonas flava]|uniref:Alkaline phosphatase n=2 Tax=Pacificimonas TaxID=1960290 RepID=A0A219B401_9SPHN|nr:MULTISPECIES: alkaline phosphatase D family protein [Pacificimonas]MBZ6377178.1 alkaline phosphatase D family protein [Pacificimonas aurantium]OWV33100.1 alkaline phosphatase [Pacificimonas flava]